MLSKATSSYPNQKDILKAREQAIELAKVIDRLLPNSQDLQSALGK